MILVILYGLSEFLFFADEDGILRELRRRKERDYEYVTAIEKTESETVGKKKKHRL